MRTFVIVAIVTVALFFFVSYKADHLPTSLDLGQPVPEATLILAGNEDSTADIRDLVARKATVIDVMASWCVPCKETIAPLERLVDSIGRDRLQVVYVAYDDPSDTALLDRFFQEAGLAHRPTVYVPDGNDFRYAFFARAIPRSFLVDASSRLRWQRLSSTLSGRGHAILDDEGLRVLRQTVTH